MAPCASRAPLVGAMDAQVMAIAEGQQSKSEEQGHKEYFIPYKYQSKDVLIPIRCES